MPSPPQPSITAQRRSIGFALVPPLSAPADPREEPPAEQPGTGGAATVSSVRARLANRASLAGSRASTSNAITPRPTTRAASARLRVARQSMLTGTLPTEGLRVTVAMEPGEKSGCTEPEVADLLGLDDIDD